MSNLTSRRSFVNQTVRTAVGAVMTPWFIRAETKLDFKIGQMLMANSPGQSVGSEMTRLIREFHLGGVLLFENNFSTAAKPKESLQQLVRQLHQTGDTPLLIALDQEGGAVNRLKEKYGFPPTLSAQSLGTRNDLDETRSAASTIAQSLASLGINLNFAPVVDVKVNPANPVVGVNKRCFSSDPERVAAHAGEFVRAHREKNIITTLKHFPGHGSSASDSHNGLTDVSATWSSDELIPYKKLISQNLADSIMTAHIFNAQLDATFPASLSHKTITGLLREKLGFRGVVFSDDLLMAAITQKYSFEESIRLAINAGNDILLFTTIADNLIPRVTSIIKKHIENGLITKKRIEESYWRIKHLKEKIV